MTTWQRGRTLLRGFMLGHAKPLDEFCDEIARSAPHRVPGIAVFMTSNPGVAPPVVMAATHEETLAVVLLEDLERHATM